METTAKARFARDLMTTEVLSAQADWSLERLSEFFNEHAISGAPVVEEGGRLVGVISLSDLAKYRDQPELDSRTVGTAAYYHDLADRFDMSEMESFRMGHWVDVSIRDLMTPAVFSVFELTPLSQVADLMLRSKIHRVFVTHERHIVGIITTTDMLRVVRDM